MKPPCDPDCKPDRCTIFCDARRAYAAALDAARRLQTHPDLDARAATADRLTSAFLLVRGLHLVPTGSGLTERTRA